MVITTTADIFKYPGVKGVFGASRVLNKLTFF